MKKLVALVAAGALAVSAVAGASIAASGSAAGGSQTIAEVAAGDKRFSTLVSLLTKAGLVDELSGPGPFTVFAPTNKAFSKLPKKTLNAVSNDPELLRRVLLYHVVRGEVTAAEVVKLKSAKTLAGPRVKIAVRGGNVFVNGSKVTATDIEASNGVIHVVNKVLVPPS